MAIYYVSYPWWVRILRKWANVVDRNLERLAKYTPVDPRVAGLRPILDGGAVVERIPPKGPTCTACHSSLWCGCGAKLSCVCGYLIYRRKHLHRYHLAESGEVGLDSSPIVA